MKQSMMLIKLNEVVEKKERSLCSLSRKADILYVTPWNMSQKESQNRISLLALSKLCAALECKLGDLLEYIADAEGAAIASLIKSKAAAKKSKKSGAAK